MAAQSQMSGRVQTSRAVAGADCRQAAGPCSRVPLVGCKGVGAAVHAAGLEQQDTTVNVQLTKPEPSKHRS